MDSQPGPSRLGPWHFLMSSPHVPIPSPRCRPPSRATPSSSVTASSRPSSSSSSSPLLQRPLSSSHASVDEALLSQSTSTSISSALSRSPSPPPSTTATSIRRPRRRSRRSATIPKAWIAAAAILLCSSLHNSSSFALVAAAPPPSQSIEEGRFRHQDGQIPLPFVSRGKTRAGSGQKQDEDGSTPSYAHWIRADDRRFPPTVQQQQRGNPRAIDQANPGDEQLYSRLFDKSHDRQDLHSLPRQIDQNSRHDPDHQRSTPFVESDRSNAEPLRSRDPNLAMTPSPVLLRRNVVGGGTKPSLVARATASQAYSSGIIADWTHQGRSVWFQRKAIIIVSCFLAIFIVLIIGAAVFLRSRQTEEELNLEEQENQELADEAALKRMKEERRMRSGGRKDKKGLKGAEKGPSLVDEVKKKKGGKKAKAAAGDTSSGSGSSTAVSKMRVSRWIRSPGTFMKADRGSGDQDRSVGTVVEPSNDTASVRTSQTSSRRRNRLGQPRTERTEVEYNSADGDNSLRQVHSSEPATSDPSASSPEQSPDENHINNSDGLRSSPGREVPLDASDLRAAEAASTAREFVLPPAYITASGSSSANLPPQAVGPNSTSAVSLPRPDYTRPLAGSQAVSDSKNPSGPEPPNLFPQTAPPLGDPTDSLASASTSRQEHSAHIATDDKARLAALAAAASAPVAPSAPFYSSTDSASAPLAPWSEPEPQATPSAPNLDLDNDGFEQVPSEGLVASSSSENSGGAGPSSSPSAPSYSPETSLASGAAMYGNEGSARMSTATSSRLLPEPPRPHSQAFSPFDRPYHSILPYNFEARADDRIGSSESSMAAGRAVPSALFVEHAVPEEGESTTMTEERLRRRAEKQREADEELALLTPSSPGDYASSGRGRGPEGGISLPAYTHRSSSDDGAVENESTQGGGDEPIDGDGRAAAIAPTAPAIDTLFEEDEDEGQEEEQRR